MQTPLRTGEKWAIISTCLLGAGLFLYRWVSANTTPLIAPLYSNVEPDQARQTLHLSPERWIVTSEFDYRGAHRTAVIVTSFVDCGVTGALALAFFNQRLIQTIFYPSDFEAYLRNLARDRGISFSALKRTLSLFSSNRLYPHTSIWIGRDHQGRDSVGRTVRSLMRTCGATKLTRFTPHCLVPASMSGRSSSAPISASPETLPPASSGRRLLASW